MVTLAVMCMGVVPDIASAAPGSQLWARRYDGPAGNLDAATAVGSSPDGSMVYVTGRSRSTRAGYDYATVAYEVASGTELWATRYNGPANGDDNAAALGVSPDGSALRHRIERDHERQRLRHRGVRRLIRRRAVGQALLDLGSPMPGRSQ